MSTRTPAEKATAMDGHGHPLYHLVDGVWVLTPAAILEGHTE